MDESSVGDEWNSGETLTVTLTDQDFNKNTWKDEDMVILNTTLIPSLVIGSPLSLTNSTTVEGSFQTNLLKFSAIANVSAAITDSDEAANVSIQPGYTMTEYAAAVANADYIFLNYDITSLVPTSTGCAVTTTSADSEAVASASCGNDEVGYVQLTNVATLPTAGSLQYNFTGAINTASATSDRFFVDIFTFGDGTTTSERVNNAIYRLLLEETDDDTGVFIGDVEYIMLNQLNVDEASTFSGLTTLSDSVTIIVHEDLTDEDSPRINYDDLGADGVTTQIADQVAAPSHSGVVSFDSDNYKVADTVVITLDDQDLNVDSDLIDVYVTRTDDKVGNSGSDHLVDVTFDDSTWDGLYETGFTLLETDLASGIFMGSFQVPTGVTGQDIEVNYNDHRDASANFNMLVQLIQYEGGGDWRSINTEIPSILKITAEDIQRVAKKYLTKENRTVATNTRKPGTKAPNDPAMTGLSGEQQAVVRRISNQIKAETSLERLQQQLEAMESQLGQADGKQQGLMKIIMVKVAERIAELSK
jgi:hypothetical protein